MIGTGTPREISHHAGALVLLVADLATAGLLVGAATLTHSLTILGAAVGTVFLLALQSYVLLANVAADREMLRGLEFGPGKVQETVSAALGVGLLVGGLWILERILGVALGFYETARPADLALAALANTFALLVGILGYVAAKRFRPTGRSLEFRSHLVVRRSAINGALVLQVPLTISLVISDPAISFLADALGAAFVAILALWHGVTALRLALPDLMDAPPPRSVRLGICKAVEDLLPPGELAGIRMRRSGRAVEAEITITGKSCGSAADLARLQGEITRHLSAGDTAATVALLLTLEETSHSAAKGHLSASAQMAPASDNSWSEDTL